MKTLNVRKDTPIQVSEPLDIIDRHPCWYINLKDAGERDKTKWVVGVKSSQSGESTEFKLLLTDLSDPEDDVGWANTTSLDFALKLMDNFKAGTIWAWINGGCVI